MSQEDAHITPGLGVLYLRALRQRKKSIKGKPKLEGRYILKNPAADLSNYRSFYGLPEKGGVPISFFFILGTRPILTLLTDKECPAPAALGLVQTGLEVTRKSNRETIDEDVVAKCQIEMGAGPILSATVSLATESGTPLAEIEAQFFDRSRKDAGSDTRKPTVFETALPASIHSEIAFQHGRGRRYAKVSGDWNPIHLSWVFAKIFGLKRPIIHGLDSVASLLGRLDIQHASRLNVQFLKPIFIPSKALLRYDRTDPALLFSLTDKTGDREYLKGSVD